MIGMIGFIADMIEHPMKRWKQMIEMRVVDNGLMCRPDFQYRHRILIADAIYKLFKDN